MYMAFLLPGIVLALLATFITQSTFRKYSKYGVSSGLSGAEAARRLLDSQGLTDVEIRETRGFLSDHYDPRTRTLNLSPDVYNGASLSAIGVACHEAGHALQDAHAYVPLHLRTALVPATQIGSNLYVPIFVLGFLFRMPGLITVAILLLAMTVIFSLITLPVEWDATARAKRLMVSSGIVTPAEGQHAAAVLNAAFMTYVASAVTAILTLLYYLFRAGFLGRRND